MSERSKLFYAVCAFLSTLSLVVMAFYETTEFDFSTVGF